MLTRPTQTFSLDIYIYIMKIDNLRRKMENDRPNAIEE